MTGTEETGSKRTTLIIVSILTLVAVVLRLIGNRHGFPWMEEPDAESVYLGRFLAEGGSWQGLLKTQRYPLLLTYFYIPLFDLFSGVSDIWLARSVSGLLGGLTTAYVFLLGRAIGGVRVGILAAAVFAVDVLSVQGGHLVKPHAPLALFMTASLYHCTRLLDGYSLKQFAWAGLFGMAAASTLHSGFVVVFAMAVAVLMMPPPPRRWTVSRYLGRGPLSYALILLLAFPVGYPVVIVSIFEWMSEGAGVHELWSGIREGMLGAHPDSMVASIGIGGLGRIPFFLLQFAPVMLLVTGVSLVAGIIFRPRWFVRLLPALIMTLAFLLLLGTVPTFAPRFMIPIVPVLCVVVASFASWVTFRTASRPAKVAFWALVCILVLPRAAVSIQLDRLWVTDDTRVVAARQMQELVRPGETVVSTPFLDFPLPLDSQSIAERDAYMDDLTEWDKQWRDGGPPGFGSERTFRFHFPFWNSWEVTPEERMKIVDDLGADYALGVFNHVREVQDANFNVFAPLGEPLLRVATGEKNVHVGPVYAIPWPFITVWWLERPGPEVVLWKVGGT